MTVDKNKKYRTQDGKKVRIYAHGCGGTFCIHGAVRVAENLWVAETWTAEGRCGIPGSVKAYDLVEVTEGGAES